MSEKLTLVKKVTILVTQIKKLLTYLQIGGNNSK